MSYYHVRKAQIAKEYLANRDLVEREKQREDEKLTASRVWLADYLARPRASQFTWGPHFPATPPEETNAAETDTDENGTA